MPAWDPVLDFWLAPASRPLWFAKNDAFDQEIKHRFGDLWQQARIGAIDHWQEHPEGAFALIIVLDQFSRNMFRGDALAFAADPQARQHAKGAIDRGFDQVTPLDHRFFFYLPFEHSESLADQEKSVALFEAWAHAHEGAAREKAFDQLRYVHRHHEIIARFGRFPHRNDILGRPHTPEEQAFLSEPMSAF